MIENQAYIVALMLLIASPIAIASDEGQAVLERFERTPDDLIDVEKNDRTEALDDLLKEDILNDVPTDKIDTKDVVEDCYTLEQWKERLSDYDWNKEDWERESDEVREESNDGARGNSDDKEQKEDYNKETDKVTDKVTDKDCFTEAEFEEYVDKMVSKENTTIVFDNEPRNKDIVKQMKKTILRGWTVCVWPEKTSEKDINDMILAGQQAEEIEGVINRNKFAGLEAQFKLNEWKKI